MGCGNVPKFFPGGRLIPEELRRKLAKEVEAIRKRGGK